MVVLYRAADRPPVRCLSPQDLAKVPAEQRLTILLVEDDFDTADCQARILTLSGFNVHVGASPPDAIALAVSHRFDVALIDLGLRHPIDGIDLGSMLRDLPGNGNLALVALTGWPDQKFRAAEARFDGYLLKPVQPCHIFDAIHEVVRRRSLNSPHDAD